MNSRVKGDLAGSSAETDAGKSPETGEEAEEEKRGRAKRLHWQYEQLRILNN